MRRRAQHLSKFSMEEVLIEGSLLKEGLRTLALQPNHAHALFEHANAILGLGDARAAVGLFRRAAAALITGSAVSVLLRLREAASTASGAVLVASPPTERRFGGCGAASIACEGRVLCSVCFCQKATL